MKTFPIRQRFSLIRFCKGTYLSIFCAVDDGNDALVKIQAGKE